MLRTLRLDKLPKIFYSIDLILLKQSLGQYSRILYPTMLDQLIIDVSFVTKQAINFENFQYPTRYRSKGFAYLAKIQIFSYFIITLIPSVFYSFFRVFTYSKMDYS